MTSEACEKFVKGFFEAFKLELMCLEHVSNTEIFRYHYGDIDRAVVMKNLEDREVRIGELKIFLNEVFKFANIEADQGAEYIDAMETLEQVDRLIVRFYSDVKNNVDCEELLQTVSQSRE